MNSMPHVMPTYARLPVAFTRGEGVWVWDTQGKRYLDCLSGIAVTGIGHNHPRLTRAITEQAGRMLHASNLYHIPEQEALAAKLCDVSGMDSIFFCNSGCEANEAAIKLARLHGHQRGVETPAIVVMEKAFHGRTIATLVRHRQPQGAGRIRTAALPDSCAYPTTIAQRCSTSARTIATSSRCWWNRCRAKAASTSLTMAISRTCARSATAKAGC